MRVLGTIIMFWHTKPCTHASVHSCIPCAHVQMHLCTYASMHLCTHDLVQPCTHAPMRLCVHALMYVGTHASVLFIANARALPQRHSSADRFRSSPTIYCRVATVHRKMSRAGEYSPAGCHIRCMAGEYSPARNAYSAALHPIMPHL